ncbi:MAG: hypothetical protein D6725_12725 [Planctomycetota bacterium]|nr:MAG: hypothetical protein D6725_12725 [Planctomycetota bacterium]
MAACTSHRARHGNRTEKTKFAGQPRTEKSAKPSSIAWPKPPKTSTAARDVDIRTNRSGTARFLQYDRGRAAVESRIARRGSEALLSIRRGSAEGSRSVNRGRFFVAAVNGEAESSDLIERESWPTEETQCP